MCSRPPGGLPPCCCSAPRWTPATRIASWRTADGLLQTVRRSIGLIMRLRPAPRGQPAVAWQGRRPHAPEQALPQRWPAHLPPAWRAAPAPNPIGRLVAVQVGPHLGRGQEHHALPAQFPHGVAQPRLFPNSVAIWRDCDAAKLRIVRVRPARGRDQAVVALDRGLAARAVTGRQQVQAGQGRVAAPGGFGVRRVEQRIRVDQRVQSPKRGMPLRSIISQRSRSESSCRRVGAPRRASWPAGRRRRSALRLAAIARICQC